jgi:hypothetical protein
VTPATPDTTTPPATTDGTGKDALTLHVAADSWQGNPNFIVTVDGKQVGGTQTATASHAAGQWQDVTLHGDFAAGAHDVKVTFLNDAWSGKAGEDRNLYVSSIDINGQHVAAAAGKDAAALMANGSITIHADAASGTTGGTDTTGNTGTTGTTGTGGTGTTGNTGTTGGATGGTTAADGTLVIHASADAWQGAAKFVVTVDGKPVGDVQSVSASHAAGKVQDITLHGNFDAGAHDVAVSFTNDAWGGTAATDRNLYVDSIEMNGHQVAGSSAVSNTAANGSTDAKAAALMANGTATFHVAAASTDAGQTGGTTGTTGTTGGTDTTGTTGTSDPAVKTADFSDGHGHDVFVFDTLGAAPVTIQGFHPGEDILDIAPVLKAAGYTGQDPIADGLLHGVADGANTVVMLGDVKLATLDGVQPNQLQHADFWH